MIDNKIYSGKKGIAWDVYIGSTHVANPEDFLEQVRKLTGKFLYEVFFFGLNNLELEEPDEGGINNPAYEPSTLLDITRGNSEDLLIK